GRRKSLSLSSAAPTLMLRPPSQLGERSEHDTPYHRQSVRTAAVNRVLRGMVIAAQEGSKVDDVHGWHAGCEERQVVILNWERLTDWKGIAIIQTIRTFEDDIPEPGRGVGLRPELRIASADHIEQQHGLNVTQFSRATECFNEISTPVKAVGRGPVLDRLLAVEENKPMGQSMRFAGQNSCQLNKSGRTRPADVRAHKRDSLEPRRVVVAGDDHYLRAFARQDAHDVH